MYFYLLCYMLNKHIVASLIKVRVEYFSDYKWKKKRDKKAKQFYVKMVTKIMQCTLENCI